MLSVKEAESLTKEIAELLKSATTEQKLQIKGILIGTTIASKQRSGTNNRRK